MCPDPVCDVLAQVSACGRGQSEEGEGEIGVHKLWWFSEGGG